MKKLSLMLTAFLMAFVLFAQEVPSCGLKDSDVKNFIKNYNKLEKELEKYDLELDDASTFTNKDVKKIENILEKNGISGPNSFLKVQTIVYGSIYILGEDQLGKEHADVMFGQYKALINSKDLKIVQNNKKDLLKLFSNIANKDNDDLFEVEGFDDDDVEGLLDGLKDKAKNKAKKAAKESVKEKAKNKLNNKIPGAGALSFLDSKSDKNNSNDTEEDTVAYVKAIEKKLTSSKKDVGPLYKKYDSKNASKYKKAKSQERVYDLFFEYPEHNPIPNSAKFYFNYNNEWGDNEYATCSFQYFDKKGNLKDKKEIKVKVLSFELYESDTGFEVIYQTDKFGTLRFWSNYGDKNRNNKTTYFGNDGIMIQGEYGESVA